MVQYFGLAILIICADQGLKYWIVSNISLNQTQTVMPGLLSLTHLRNTGAAWSILEGQRWFFYVITLVAVAIICYLLFTQGKKNWLFALGLSFMLAGAIGNFIDRLRLGYVVDMFQLDFINFPIFNIADSSLTIGVILIFCYLIFFDEKRGTTA
ncbi:signal peptidase II [Loigolactobacillus iwatensis]|uniref:signal peptidase II n=1 Tax=Loigolactobacillus iwatensis TaxID=1267156 RepID=UPI000F7F4F6E|nr:signal peptidase II [Loigolactobacillus iwatensis]